MSEMCPIERRLFPNNIPNELKELSHWVTWRLETKKTKLTKVPFNPNNGQFASVTKPSCWSTFELALEVFENGGFDGIGFVFTGVDPYIGIDLDKCRDPETGHVEQWAADIVTDLDTYTEISQSGAGLHLIVKSELLQDTKHKTSYCGGAVEIYDRGRYFVMTGNCFGPVSKDIADRSVELQSVYTKTFGAGEPTHKRREPAQAQKVLSIAKWPTFEPARRTFHPSVDDEELLALARSAENGQKFTALFDEGVLSGYDGDHSGADLALCSILAHWTQGDYDRIDRLFRLSKLMRPKWDRRRGQQTYGALTISKVLRRGTRDNKREEDEGTTSGKVGDNSEPMETMTTLTIEDKRSKFGLRSAKELSDRVSQLGKDKSVIDPIIPGRSLGMIVGDSGLGKSPLLYQAAMCVAAGIPFLDFPVTQGPVIYFDFENGLGQVNMILEKMRQHLNLPKVPDELHLWNRNDPESDRDILAAIRDLQPTLAIIDSLSAYCPDAEERNSKANSLVGRFRPIMASAGCTILGVHHLRKPSADPKTARLGLECDNVHEWLKQARGAAALINSWDFRIGIDRPKVELPRLDDSGANRRREIALVMGGFERVNGTMPFLHIGRVFDDDGEPLGYTRITGEAFLSVEQRAVLSALPSQFRFTHAKTKYAKGSEATQGLLQKCISLGLVRKNMVAGLYEKTQEIATHNSQNDGPIPKQLLFPAA
jgi:putative DNA primase/helicase